MTDKIKVTIAIKLQVMYGLSIGVITIDLRPFYILKAKVMHISTMNILEMVRDMEKITIAIN